MNSKNGINSSNFRIAYFSECKGSWVTREQLIFIPFVNCKRQEDISSIQVNI